MIENKYNVLFYNRFAQQQQTFKVISSNEENAERLFYLKHPIESYHDCIEYIEEVGEEHYFTEEELLNESR
jgi:hypothetical protein